MEVRELQKLQGSNNLGEGHVPKLFFVDDRLQALVKQLAFSAGVVSLHHGSWFGCGEDVLYACWAYQPVHSVDACECGNNCWVATDEAIHLGS